MLSWYSALGCHFCTDRAYSFIVAERGFTHGTFNTRFWNCRDYPVFIKIEKDYSHEL